MQTRRPYMQTRFDSSLATAIAAEEKVKVGRPTVWRTIATAIFSFPMMCYSLLVMAMFQWCWKAIGEHDIWWHMLNARHLLQHHAFTRVDMYSFTAAGSPWLDHEWLSEIVFYLGYNSFGLRGLLAVYFVILMLIIAGIYYRATRISENCKNAPVATA